MAQESKWDTSLKLFAGGLTGSAADITANAENFGAAIEATYKLDKASCLAFDFGYRFYPGGTQFLSTFGVPANSTGTAGQVITGETRLRKSEANGFQASALYRRDAFMEGMFWQAGLRIGLNKTKSTDTGSVYSYTKGATTWGLTSVTVIDSMVEKKTTSIGLLAGLGYRFNDRYTGGLNAYTVKLEGPGSGKKSGTVVELDLGIRF